MKTFKQFMKEHYDGTLPSAHVCLVLEIAYEDMRTIYKMEKHKPERKIRALEKKVAELSDALEAMSDDYLRVDNEPANDNKIRE